MNFRQRFSCHISSLVTQAVVPLPPPSYFHIYHFLKPTSVDFLMGDVMFCYLKKTLFTYLCFCVSVLQLRAPGPDFFASRERWKGKMWNICVSYLTVPPDNRAAAFLRLWDSVIHLQHFATQFIFMTYPTSTCMLEWNMVRGIKEVVLCYFSGSYFYLAVPIE